MWKPLFRHIDTKKRRIIMIQLRSQTVSYDVAITFSVHGNGVLFDTFKKGRSNNATNPYIEPNSHFNGMEKFFISFVYILKLQECAILLVEV